ncbi:MAG: hypothetical protein ABFS22_10720 [Pseudomonadota bacterium]
MKGKLTEPMTITDYRQQLVCILPVGFYFSDDRWDLIWKCFEEKGDALTHDDLRKMFPDEPVLHRPAG